MLERIKEIGPRYSRNTNLIKKVFERLNLHQGLKILDVGTGSGVMAIHLALYGLNVISGEPRSHDYADWRTPAKKIGVFHFIDFVLFNAEKMDFEDAQFDHIFVYGSLHHIHDLNKAFREFSRVLISNGKLIILEPNEAMIEEIKKLKPNHPNRINPIRYSSQAQFDLESVLSNDIFDAYIFRKEKN